jgi:hypothetical protein
MSEGTVHCGHVNVAQKARKLRVSGSDVRSVEFESPPLHVLRERVGVRVLLSDQTVFAAEKTAPHPPPPPGAPEEGTRGIGKGGTKFDGMTYVRRPAAESGFVAIAGAVAQIH